MPATAPASHKNGLLEWPFEAVPTTCKKKQSNIKKQTKHQKTKLTVERQNHLFFFYLERIRCPRRRPVNGVCRSKVWLEARIETVSLERILRTERIRAQNATVARRLSRNTAVAVPKRVERIRNSFLGEKCRKLSWKTIFVRCATKERATTVGFYLDWANRKQKSFGTWGNCKRNHLKLGCCTRSCWNWSSNQEPVGLSEHCPNLSERRICLRKEPKFWSSSRFDSPEAAEKLPRLKKQNKNAQNNKQTNIDLAKENKTKI